MYEVRSIRAIVGMQSCIGVGGTPPHSWGNYFWIGNLRIVNFWSENLEAAVEQFLHDGNVTVRVFSSGDREWGVVHDARIPREWYNKHPCFTGYGVPKDEAVLRAIYEASEDFSDDIEQWLNPQQYHEARGGTVKFLPGGGHVVSYKLDQPKRELKGEWTIETKPVVAYDPDLVDDIAMAYAYALTAINTPTEKPAKGFFYAPYIPKELNATRLDSTDSSVDRSRQEDSQPKGTEAL